MTAPHPARAVALLTLVGAVLRFATLDVESFWYDEAVTVGLVELGLFDMLDRIPDSESTPPLYYVLAWLWTQAFGTGEVGIRSLSALAGTATIPVAYAAGSALLRSRRVGVAVAALAAASPILVWYSQEARAYALLVLLAGLSLWAFGLLRERPADRRAWVLWAVSSALALATHYFAVFLVAAEAVWLLAWRPTRRGAAWAAGAVTLAALALVPLAIHQRSLDLASFIRDESLPARVARTGKNLLIGFEAPLENALAVLALAIAAAGVVIALARRDREPGAVAAAALGAAAVLAPIVLAIAGADYLTPRNALAAWLPLAAVAAAGLVSRRAGRAGVAGVAVLCAIGLVAVVAVAVTPPWERDDWRGMSDAIGPATVPRVLVVQPANGNVPLRVYEPNARPLPTAGVEVAEIVLLHPVQRDVGGAHPGPPPRPAERPRVAGFREVERLYEPTFTLIRFRARTPRRIAPFHLGAVRLDTGEPISPLVQTGR